MKIRQLKAKDAPLMLEWMHDETITAPLKKDFANMTIKDAESFIKKAQRMDRDLHLAIVDETDTYMGTVSLKNITEGTAEFGIAIRASAMKKGFSHFGMEEICKIGFEIYGLTQIYCPVNPENLRALRFYDKNGYQRVKPGKILHIEGYTKEEIKQHIWYAINR